MPQDESSRDPLNPLLEIAMDPEIDLMIDTEWAEWMERVRQANAQLGHIEPENQYALRGDAPGVKTELCDDCCCKPDEPCWWRRAGMKTEQQEDVDSKLTDEDITNLLNDDNDDADADTDEGDDQPKTFDLPKATVPPCARRHQREDDRLQCESCVDRREAVREAIKLRQAARSEDMVYTVASLGDLDPDKIAIGKRTMCVFSAAEEGTPRCWLRERSTASMGHPAVGRPGSAIWAYWSKLGKSVCRC
jgi:hypothetical protein